MSPLPAAPLTLGDALSTWRILVGGLVLVALVWDRCRRAGDRSRVARQAALFTLVCLAAFIGRRWFIPPTWFHQFGEGPQWVEMARMPFAGHVSHYGTGFATTFWLPSRLFSDPAAAVFAVQGLLAALALPALFTTARSCGAPPAFAAAIVAVFATDPALGRACDSESYFATIHSFLSFALAALALALEASSRRLRLAGLFAGGLLAAHAASCHPYAWAAAPVVGLVILLHSRRRSISPPHVSGEIALFALGLATMIPGARQQLATQIGSSWVDRFREVYLAGATAGVGVGLLGVALIAAGLVAWRLRFSRAATGALFLPGYAILAGHYRMQLSPHVYVAVERAYSAMLATVAVPPLAAVLSLAHALPRRALSYSLAGALVAPFGLRALVEFTPDTRLPMEILQEQAWERWSKTLPPGSVVAYSRQAGPIIQIHLGRSSAGAAPDHAFELYGDGAQRIKDERVTHYLRAIGCSTREGAARCAEIEAAVKLEEIASAELPNRPSDFIGTIDAPSVRIALYKVIK